MRVMIVEDDPLTSLNWQESLSELGYHHIFMASNCSDALFLAKTKAPEVALLDIAIKGDKDGVSLANYLREEFKLIIIFVTGTHDPVTLRRVSQVEPDGFVAKPANATAIRTAIDLARISRINKTRKDIGSGQRQVHPEEDRQDYEGLSPHQVNVAKDYIEKNFNRCLSVAEVAKQVNLSSDHFAKKFKQAECVSPQNFIMQRKIEEAKHLLAYTDLPISEVAKLSGFCSPAHLANCFKTQNKMTPGQYRRR